MPAGNRKRERQLLVCGLARKRDIDDHAPQAAGKCHLRTKFAKPRAGPALQRHRLPDARRDQRRAPVPAEIAGHFPHERPGTRIVCRNIRRRAKRGSDLRPIVLDGQEIHFEMVTPFAQKRCHVETEAAMHVPCTADDLTVKPDIGHRVEAFEQQFVVRMVLVRPVEFGRIAPG